MSVELELARHGSGTPLLLLHPLGADARFFGPLTERLDHDVWTAELVGHGRSQCPTPYRIAEVADALAEALQRTVDGQVAVVGVSLGGLVAQHLAAEHPEVVSHVVLCDTVVRYPEPMREMWGDRAQLVRTEGTEAVLEATLDIWFGASPPPSLAAVCREMLLGTDPEAYALACEALRDADTRGVVDDIQQPTAVLCGDLDAPAFIADAQVLADRLVVDRTVTWLPGAHHAALLEQPGRAAALIGAHVREEEIA